MRAGRLRHRVTLQTPDPTSPRDSAGQRLTRWNTLARSVPAYVRPLDADENFIAAQRHSSATHVVRLRYSPMLSEFKGTGRFLFGRNGSRVLIVEGPPTNVDEANEELEFSCIEGLRNE